MASGPQRIRIPKQTMDFIGNARDGPEVYRLRRGDETHQIGHPLLLRTHTSRMAPPELSTPLIRDSRNGGYSVTRNCGNQILLLQSSTSSLHRSTPLQSIAVQTPLIIRSHSTTLAPYRQTVIGRTHQGRHSANPNYKLLLHSCSLKWSLLKNTISRE